MREEIQLNRDRQVIYIGSSLKDLSGFPDDVKDTITTAIEVARLGSMHEAAKPWKGVGPGVFQIVLDDGDAYRAVYTVRFKEAIYVLHAFQKKSTTGRNTSQSDIAMVERRLGGAKSDHARRYGKEKGKRKG